MAQNNNDHNIHPFPFMQLQNPNPNPSVVETSVSSPSRNLQDTSGVQNLVSGMNALNLSNPYRFIDYYWINYHHRIKQESEMRRMRIIYAAKQVQQHHHQKKLETATPQEMYNILRELRCDVHELMKHPSGHNAILKIFQSSNNSMNKVKVVIYMIVNDLQKFKDVCMDDQGNRVVQNMFETVIEKMLEGENQNMIQIITNSLRLITVPLMKSFNGGYVIQKYMKLFQPAHKKVIYDVIARNFVDIARDKCGCCVIQKCMELAEPQSLLQLINKLISNVVFLAEDAYGNFVVQFLIKQEILGINKMLISLLRTKHVRLSKNKHASNVVEALLKFSETEDAAIIVHELMNNPEFFYLLVHPYGNYVVQRALEYTQGPLHLNLYSIIVSHHRNLSSSLHGKKVLSFAKQCRLRGLQNGI